MPDKATPKPKNLRRLYLRIEDQVPEGMSEPVPEVVTELRDYINKLVEKHNEQNKFQRTLVQTLNEHHIRIEEAFADAAGHSGDIGVAGDIDLQGHVIKNSGKVKHKDSIPTLGQVGDLASFSAATAVNQALGALDITQIDGGEELLDLDIPAFVTELTLEWVRKVGFLARWSPPVNVKRTLGYFISFFNDDSGVVWMHPTTGQVVADQAAAETKVTDATHFSTNVSLGDLAEPFASTGVKVRVVALVRIKGKGKVRGKLLDYPTLVTPGGDPGLGSSAFTGTAVPELYMGLERSNTGAASPANTTTTYYLDAAASAIANHYVGSAEREFFIELDSMGSADVFRKITAYDEAAKKITVSPAWSAAPGSSAGFIIHRGLVTGGKSGTGHGTTTFVGASTDSSVDGHYKGMMLFIFDAPAGQQIQKITAYTGASRTYTIEPAPGHVVLAGAPANNCCYLVSKGSFGYAFSNQTGLITAVPFRVWLDGDLVKNVVEPIPPDDANAYFMTKGYCVMKRASTGKIKYEKKLEPDSNHDINAPSAFLPMLSMKWRGPYRGGGSDGWSEDTYWVPGYKSTDTPTAYSPTDFPAPEIDYQREFPVGL